MARAIEKREQYPRKTGKSPIIDESDVSKTEAEKESADAKLPDITVLDLSESMLEIGKQRAVGARLDSSKKLCYSK